MQAGSISGDYSQAQLELTDVEIGGVYIDETYQTNTSPIDPLSNSKIRDIRDIPMRK